jgi:hypothetical protein
MTCNTERYEVLGSVIAEAAPRLHVVNLKVPRATADLATPTVPFQNFTA